MENKESSKIPSQQNLSNSSTYSISNQANNRTTSENINGKKEKKPMKQNMQKNIGRKYLGVRQRPSGRWVAEIKDSSQKLRLWLGTFNTAEEAALAYDGAARLLRGRNTKTNFPNNDHNGNMMMNSTPHQENCRLFGKNPRLHQILQHAVLMKNLHGRSSEIPSVDRDEGNNQVDHSLFSFHSLVEDTIICSSSVDDNNPHGVSIGCSKVYSSVIVAPSFSASLCQEEENKT